MLVESTMMPLGTKAPDFTLPNTVSGKVLSLSDIQSDKATVIIFTCNHCPFALHINPEFKKVVGEYQPKGVVFIAICSNDINSHPDDAPDKMTELAKREGWNFPYLFDETQEIALAYDAACTPDIFVFDGEMKLYYRGRFDASRPRNEIPLTGSDLRSALDLILRGAPAPENQYPSAGCNIKWRPENAHKITW